MKVALLGTAPSTRMLAPFQDQSWEIWACSPANQDLPRITAFFQLHVLRAILDEPKGPSHLEWLNNQSFPVFMQEENNYVARAKAFPKDELVKEFGPYWFTSSIAWMMAYAIQKGGVEEIALYGIDMSHMTEYALQKPGCVWFVEEAKRRGIKISVPPGSDVLTPPPLYGYAEATAKGTKLYIRRREVSQRKAEFRNEIAELEAKLAQMRDRVTYFTGAEEQLNYEYLQSWECYDPEFPRRPATGSVGERQELPQRGAAAVHGPEVLRPEPSGPWEHPCA
jgi:hypothetical protein